MRLAAPVLVFGCLAAFPAATLSGAGAEMARADSAAVTRFINDIEKEPIPYQANRRLEASSTDLGESAWMEAFTEYSREGGFSYRVVAQGGSQRIQNRALRGVLEGEKETTAQWRRGALTRENYDFAFDSRSPDGLLKIQLNPRRRDSRLLDGAAWVSAQSGELVRLEGRLSKSPSFWIRWVRVKRHYRSVGGTMMPASMDSTADVKIAGVSTLSMTYDYVAINGQAVSSPPQILASR
jgi:hypothetical protein